MNSNENSTNAAWEKLFAKYNILAHIQKEGLYRIKAQQIKEEREPRLMAKFDHLINLPPLFRKYGLSILPVSRGSYIIAHFDAYHPLEHENGPITKVAMPAYIQTIDSNDIYSEAVALNCAAASGIIADFVEDEKMVATTAGRMGSGQFAFTINDAKLKKSHHVVVHNAQIEIDAAYEGLRYLTLFEAKRDTPEDFLVRQLYYPFCTWKARIDKPIKLVFFLYSNGIYNLYEYRFEENTHYNSLVLVKQKKYSIDDTLITKDDIERILYSVILQEEDDIPFPQADKFARIVNICELVKNQELDKQKITECYAFDIRQTEYYTGAAQYLGLLEKNKKDGIYQLSEKGNRILRMNFRQRQLAFCECILSHKVFNQVMRKYFSIGNMPNKSEVVAIMKECCLYNLKSDETYSRRASTIIGWLRWMLALTREHCSEH